MEWLPGDVGGAEGLGQEDEHLVKKKMLMMMPMQETQPAFPPLLDEYDDEHSSTPHLGEFVKGLPGRTSTERVPFLSSYMYVCSNERTSKPRARVCLRECVQACVRSFIHPHLKSMTLVPPRSRVAAALARWRLPIAEIDTVVREGTTRV